MMQIIAGQTSASVTWRVQDGGYQISTQPVARYCAKPQPITRMPAAETSEIIHL